MLKDILVNLPLEIATRDHVSEFAVSLGSQFDADLTGTAYDIKPALQPSIMGVFPNHIMQNARAEMKRIAEAAKERFEATARRENARPQCLFSSVGSLVEAAESFANKARRFDLSMVGQPKEEILSREAMFIQAALFDSGRPLLVIPYIHHSPAKVDRVTVCWDGGRAAARALADAMPLLRKAKEVDVLVVTSESPKSNEVPGADIAQHLAHHELPVTLREVAGNSLDVGNTILNFAADNATDLLVMGGYGHWRMREFILGGATRTILNSMTVPTLLLH